MRHAFAWLAAAALLAGCRGADAPTAQAAARATIPLTIEGAGGRHTFRVEVAKSVEDQRQGLMFRAELPADGGMLFAPYPGDGGPPRVASFWMKDTPAPLDIVFIRPDRTIANIAENTVPYSEAPVTSTDPVSAVLELRGGRTAELGIAAGDRVAW
jgi:uncharacterized membrane protein (UPF0127 family)